MSGVRLASTSQLAIQVAFHSSTAVLYRSDEMSIASKLPVVVIDYFHGSAAPADIMDIFLALSAKPAPGTPPSSIWQKAKFGAWAA